MLSKRGFSLIELLVVISIIALLSSLVMASLSNAKQKARLAAKQLELNDIRNQIYINFGSATTTTSLIDYRYQILDTNATYTLDWIKAGGFLEASGPNLPRSPKTTDTLYIRETCTGTAILANYYYKKDVGWRTTSEVDVPGNTPVYNITGTTRPCFSIDRGTAVLRDFITPSWVMPYP